MFIINIKFVVIFLLSYKCFICGPIVGFAGCSACCAAVHAPEFPFPPLYATKFAACMLGCIPMELKVMSGVMVEIQNFKRIAGGFDFRDPARSGAGFALKFTPTP
jgi:hypothetical protein